MVERNYIDPRIVNVGGKRYFYTSACLRVRFSDIFLHHPLILMFSSEQPLSTQLYLIAHHMQHNEQHGAFATITLLTCFCT